MASNERMRLRDRSACAERFAVRRLPASPAFLLATAVAMGLAALLLLAQLASQREQRGGLSPSAPAFLTRALGAPQASASLVRRPLPGISVRVDRSSHEVALGDQRYALTTVGAGSAEWRSFEHGVARRTPFGSEAVTVSRKRSEQFLTVQRRQGKRTWRWKVGGAFVPRVAPNGWVGMLAGNRLAPVELAPVEILDAKGRDVTPKGLRWTTARRGGAWFLELKLDDAKLPVPYVIDPAWTWRSAPTFTNGAGAGFLDMTAPASVQPNDLLIAVISVKNAPTITEPIGADAWTMRSETASGGFIRIGVYYRVAVAGDAGKTFRWNFGSSQAAVGGISAYYGLKATSPAEAAVSNNTGNNGTPSALSINTTVNNSLAVAAYALNLSGGASTPGGWAEHLDANNGPANGSVTLDDKTQGTAGATGNADVAGPGGRWVANQSAYFIDDVNPTAGTHSDPGANISGTVTVSISGQSDADSGIQNVQFQYCLQPCGTWTNIGAADTTAPYSTTWDTTGVSDGLYDLRAVVTDWAGNTANTAVVTSRRVDNTAPDTTATFPGAGPYNANAWDADCSSPGGDMCGTASDPGASASGLQKVQVSIKRNGATNKWWDGTGFNDSAENWRDASGTSTWSLTWTSGTFPADDSYTVRVRALDNANNADATPISVTFNYDNTAPGLPSITSSSPASPANDNNPEITGSAEAGSTVKLYTNSSCTSAVAASGTEAAFGSPGLTVTVSDNTSPTFYATATDAAGNVSSCSAGYTYTEDSTAPGPPSFSGSSPASPANDNNPEISGSAEAGSTVKLYTDSGCTSAVAASGTEAAFSSPGLTVTVSSDMTTTFWATATDQAGNPSTCSSSSFAYTEDSTPPADPTGLTTTPVSPANDNAPAVKGTADPGTTIKIYTNDCSGPPTATGTAALFTGSGIGVFVSNDTTTTFKATATDAANNTSGCSSGVTYVEDSTAPGVPTGLATVPASPANNNDPRVKGSAEAGTTVNVYASADCTGPVAATGTDAAFGGAGLDPPNVPDDSSTPYTAKAVDAAGNPSACSSAITYVEDSTPPGVPTGLATSPASPANNNDPRVTGTAPAGTTVDLYATGDCSGAVVATGTAAAFGGGGFDPPNVADDSTTSYSAKALDAALNASACSSPVSYIEDSTAPPAPTGLATVPASPANDNDPRVKGSAEAGSTVNLYATADCTGAVAATGSAALFGGAGLDPANVADDSTTSYGAKALDAAGNPSACSSPVSYIEDSTAPAAPTGLATVPASPANDNDPRVKGSAEAGSTVNLYATADCTGAIVASGSAAAFGGAGLDPADVPDDSSTSYTAKATDAAGNPSACSSAVSYVEDSTAPPAPSGLSTNPASPANNNDPKVTGTAEAGSTVNLYASADCTGAVAASGSAATFAGAGLDPANVADDSTTSYTAKAVDAAGNPSACSTAVSYVEDSTAPPAPSGLGTNPASPANNNDPKITGTAEAGSTVNLYATADCTGAVAASGSAVTFAGAGLDPANVADDSTTSYTAKAVDAAGNPSACSSAVTYVEDSTAPGAPSGLGTNPASPANNNDPKVTGTAEVGSTVNLYATADCSGAVAASGTAATFAGAGLDPANVADDSTTTYTAKATDAAGNSSACSSAIGYVEDSTPPAVPTAITTTPSSPANDNDPELTGTADAGTTVKIFTTSDCSGAPAASGTAATFGSTGITASVANDTTTTFKATATDAAGNPSGCSAGVTYVEDSTAPAAPTGLASSPASPANDNDPELTGSAEAGSTVKLYTTSDCSGAPAASGTAAQFGGTGITASVANDSSTTFKATATDAAGNTSGCSSGYTYVEDSTAPAAPSTLSSSPGSPANDNDPELTGSAEAGSTVKLYTTSDCSGAPVTSGAAGAFATPGFTVSVGNDSSTTYYATATDAASNASGCSAGYTYVEDSTAPAAPTGLATSPASPANDNDPEVSGTAEAGSTVRIFTTSDCSGAPAATGAAVTFNTAGLSANVANDSTTTFKATATDGAGNASGCSTGVTYVEDSTAPAAPTGLTSSPASPANDNAPKIGGSAEAGSTVKLFTSSDCSGAPAAIGTAATFNSAGIAVSVGDDSTTTFKATATDAAGNASGCSSGTTYVEDSTAPPAPTGLTSSPASPANDNDPEVTGSAEAGSTVKLFTTSDCSGAPAATGTAAAFGSPGITATVANDSTTTFKATATDAAGNTAGCSTGVTYVEDSTAPAAPTLTASSPASPANDNAPELTGGAETGSTVRIYTASDCTGATAASGSAAAFASPGLTAPVADDSTTSFYATATDAAGNASGCSSPALMYAEDSTAPAVPSGLATTPSSPANDNNPRVRGTAEAGATVKLFTTSDCSGAPAASDTAANFAAPGIARTVADDSSTTWYATATDAAGNASACSSGVTYVEDSTAPAAPSGLSTSPASPANDNNPRVRGTAEAGATVKLFTTSDCSGAPAATDTAANFAAPGIARTVADDSTATWYTTATDTAGNASSCSSGVTYVEDSTAPPAPTGLTTSPASPANDNDPEVAASAESGSTVKLYTTSDCSGAPAATGSAAAFASPGLTASVANDSTTTFKATATDAAGNASSCSTGVTYVEDSTAPSAPSGLATSPSSPANDNDPEVTGSAEAGSTVKLYTSSDCSGAPAGTGTAAQFGGAGITASVANDSTTTFKATATDAAGNASSCSTGVTYVEDSTAPAAPGALSSTPGSPANDNSPEITGSAEAGSTVRVYASADCSGAPAATGSAAAFATPGLTVSVADDSSTTYTATATDTAGNASACSAPYTYVEDSTAPPAPSALATAPASPANDNAPKVAGTAQAGSTVKVYTSADCSGAPAATGTAASFSSPGLAVSVSDDSSTTFKATATDAAGNTSGCSAGVTYVEDSATPSSAVTFPSGGTAYNAAGWNTIGGTASDSGSGLQRVELSLRREADGTYWNGTGFSSPSEDWRSASGTVTWSFAFAESSFPADGDYTLRVRAVDQAGNVEAASTRTFTIDRQAPAAPSGLASSPGSPANDNDPELTGTAEAGSTVRLYTSSDCTGAPAASGSAASFAAPGLTASVANDSSTTFKATAIDSAGNVSACSAGYAYVEDSTAPAAPSGLASSPASPANDNDPEVTGSAEAGSTVKLYTSADCSGASAASGSAAAFASPGFTVSVANDSTTTYKATATDAAGNVSACSAGYAYVEDSTAPAAPGALTTTPSSPANDNAPKISGTAEAGATVKLYTSADCTGAPTATGSAAGFNSTGITVSVSDDTTTTFKATATDAAGNTSGCSTGVTYVEDSTAPATPTALATSPASPANDNDPEITGTADAGTTVKLYTTADCSGAPTATGTAAQLTGAGVTATVANDTTTTFKATATDPAGNTSTCSTGTTYTEDSTAPAAPTLSASSPAAPANDNAPELTGGAESGSTVRIYTASDCTGATATTGPAATFASPGLTVTVADDSTTSFYATATDAAGNTSACSSPALIYVEDSAAPAAPSALTTTPSSPANDNAPEVGGTAEAGSTVKLYTSADCSGAAAATGTAAQFGGAGITASVANDSTTTFEATATDAAGNTSGCSAGVTYTEDSTAPAAPSGLASSPVSPANDNNPEMIGSAEAGSTVKLYTTSDCSGAPAASGSAGTFASPGHTVSVANDSTTTFKATATDAAGNVSACSAGLTYVEDSTAPPAPSGLGSTPASPANDNDPEITGSAEAGTTVRLYTTSDCSGAPAASGAAAAFAAPGFTVSVANDTSTSYKATATDAAGNASACSAGYSYVEDSTAPAAPSALTTTPSSPANDNGPKVGGSAETGSTVKLYTTSDCTGAPAATGSAAAFGAGLTVSVANDTTTAFTATATDAAGNTSGCSSGVTYVEDSTAPATPTSLATSPASPANDNDPEITGSAEAGTTVKLYTSADCTGAPAATGTAALFGGAGITASVTNDTTTTFKATATDAAGNASGCSTGVGYVEDSTAPAAPTGLSVTPVSPASDNTPKISGSAEAGSSVRLYTSADCSGAPAASGSAATFGSPGLTVTVADDSSTTFKATATDAAGNTFGCSTGIAYVEDSTAPSSTASFPANTASYNIAGWNGGCAPSGICGTASDSGGSGLDRVEVSVQRGATGLYWNGSGFDSAAEDWRTASGGASWSLPLAAADFPADGSYTIRVRARDAAGNVEAAASRTFTIDTGAPSTQVDSGPADPTNSQDPSFAFSASEGGVTFECRLDAGSWGSCTSPKSYTGLAAGSHTFDVRATDAAGNTDASPASHAWTIDLTAPSSTVSFPAAGGSYNTAGWNDPAGTASDSGGAALDRVEVSLRRVSTNLYWDGSGFDAASESWRTATGAASWSLAFPAANFPADGDYLVRVRAVDTAGNTESPSSRTFTVDTVAPETTIDAAPPNPASSADASFQFSADQSGSTFQCRLDGGSWVGCASPKSYTGLAEGSHTFDVRATDAGGNTDPTPASRTWVVDTVPPAATMDNPGPYLRGTVTLTGTTSDTGGTGIASVVFERSPAGVGTWTSVPATWDTTGAADGLYDLHVKATDNAGNTTTSTAITNVRVDNTPPTAVVDSPGANVSGTVTLTHSSTDAGAGIAPASVQFQYRTSPAGPWTNTGAAWDTTALTDGLYDLRVLVDDRAGNSAASAPVTTRVDNTAPTVALTAPADGGFVNSASPDPFPVAATAADTGSGVQNVEFFACSDGSAGCSTGTWSSLGIDGDGAPYQGSWPLPASDGPRALKAVARDNATHEASAVINVTVDRAVPDTNLLTKPGDPSNAATPTFTFDSTEPGSTFECQLDGGAWAPCGSPYTTATLTDGTHTFSVRAIDAAGNTDATPATWTWLVDVTPPTAAMTDPGATLRGTITLGSTQSDPGASASGIVTIDYQYSVANAETWVSTPSTWDTTLVSDDLYDVRVVVTDRAGNVTEAAPVEDRRVDNTPPATSLDDPGANLRAAVTLTGQANDSGSGVQQVDFQISPTGANSWATIGSAATAPYQLSFDTTSYTDGIYDFRTVARDVAGNQTEGAPVVGRRIDNTPPVAIMNDPGANLRGTVNLTSTADDPGGSGVASVAYEYSAAGGGAWQGISSSWATATVTDGLYDLHVVVRDVAGNETISAPVGSRRVDNTAPSTGDNAPAGWQSSSVSVTLSPSDAGSGVSDTKYAVDGGSYTSGTSVSIAAPADGSNDGIHTISYFSTDAVGNVESPRTATVMIDATPPLPGANDPGNYLRGTVTLSASASTSGAPITQVEFQYGNSGTWTSLGVDTDAPYSVDWATTSVGDGFYDLRFIATDEAGNTSTQDLSSKIVDNTAPTAAVGSPLPGSIVSGGVTIGATALDANPIKEVEFFVRGGSIGSSSSPPFQLSWNSASGSDGPATIYVRVTDMAGNSKTSADATVTVDNFAPAVSLGGVPANVRGTVSLGASADSDAVQVTFERRPAGGGGWTTIVTDTGAPWAADFVTTSVADGVYELRAIATDGGGNSSTSSVLTTRVDNTLPNGLVTQPGDGTRVGGSAVALAATASDSGSGVSSVTFEARPSGGGAFAAIASDSGAPFEATWDVTALPSVTHELRAVVTDAAGNTFTTPVISVDVDSIAPTVTLADPGSPLSGTVTLSASTGGDADAVTFAYSPAGAASWTTIATDGSPPYGASFDTTVLADGVYDLRAVVRDSVGNTSQDVVGSRRIDNFVPVVVASVPANGSIVASANSIVLTASEPIAALTDALLDGAPAVVPVVSGTTATFNTGALANGSHTLTGKLRDASGKTSSFTISFVVGLPAAPPPAEETEPALPVEPFAAVPAPTGFRGVIERDGTLTLAWERAAGADGKPLATVLYEDGIAKQSFAPAEDEVNLGPFDAADMRTFSIAAVDADGQVSPPSVKLRSTSLLAGKPLDEVEAILINRGFELGEVHGSGSVVVEPKSPVLAPLGGKVDVELGEPEAPQTKLVFDVVGTKRFSWAVRNYIALRVKTTRPAQVTATLLSPSGERVYRWRFQIGAGTRIVKLTMPPQVKRPGRYRLVFTVQSGREVVKRTIVIDIVGKKPGKPSNPSRKPVEIVLAGSSNIRKDIALGLEDEGLRVTSAAVSDDAFALTGSAGRNVQVIVVDVDRYGVALVRDLHTVFPSVRIIALTNDPRRLAQAVKAGATVAVPRSTPPKDLAKLILRLARQPRF